MLNVKQTNPVILPTMRVISGRYKGTRLRTPPGQGTRPILDRVKGSLFDWLGSKLALPGQLPPLNACDLFCGGGSQGIEALSRGAAFCCFVENDRSALACLRANLDQLGIIETAVVVARPAESVTVSPPTDQGFGLIFLDPPYRLSEDVSKDSVMGRVLARVGTHVPVEPDALLLWRHADSCMLPKSVPGDWETVDRRSWGTMAMTMFQKSGPVSK